MYEILCYGDSNTWGYMPCTGERYPEDVRWTGVAASRLGEKYRILEDGINGRTLAFDDPWSPCRNGLEGLGYSLKSRMPLDMVVIMLGTNDMRCTRIDGYYKGLKAITRRVLNANVFYSDSVPIFKSEPKLLLVSPPTFHPDIAKVRPDFLSSHKYAETCRFAEMTALAAKEFGVEWIDAAPITQTDPVDCIHLDAESHRRLGEAVADKIRRMFEKEEEANA